MREGALDFVLGFKVPGRALEAGLRRLAQHDAMPVGAAAEIAVAIEAFAGRFQPDDIVGEIRGPLYVGDVQRDITGLAVTERSRHVSAPYRCARRCAMFHTLRSNTARRGDPSICVLSPARACCHLQATLDCGGTVGKILRADGVESIVGAYRTEAEAEAHAARLQAEGIGATIVPTHMAGCGCGA
jgi:hypothetical protein